MPGLVVADKTRRAAGRLTSEPGGGPGNSRR